jgi:hypothetical protein
VLRNLSAKNKTLFSGFIIFIAFEVMVVEILTWTVGQANLLALRHSAGKIVAAFPSSHRVRI